MNSLGEQFQCVVLLASGPADEADVATAYCVAAVMPTTGAVPLADEVAGRIDGFCAVHSVPSADWGHHTAELVAAAKGKALKHVNVLRCESSELAATRKLLLAQRNPTLLLLDITCDKAVPCNGGNDDDDGGRTHERWRWLRPTPSCHAELSNGVRGAHVYFPVAMRCSYPLFRVGAPPPLPPWTAVAVTLEGLLREVGYKVGRLPKYGS
ncbi:hypothetical protein DQ04_11011010 [Trypanosoma grayi]|uniref:hypothetical protein n=1 Tax=Trypanosoma grayi TaxID=71804 RepID=UPI0004F4525A|nr:hypothetical protein DQ04_11011010 [Trypanosoma grayi]KEG07074.1 hypothetical protein DQ04_11011010 [Trypanosoma grayi]